MLCRPSELSNSIGKVFLLVLTALLGACDSGSSQQAPGRVSRSVLVETVIVAVQPVRERVESVGTLYGNESVTLTAKVTEQVRAVYFEGGELVATGDVLVELVAAEQIALQAEASANLREVRLQLERLMTLGQDIATAAEIDVARARVDASAALLEALQSRLGERTIRAPFNGVIGFRQISVGALLTPGAVIAELDDIDTMKLDFFLPESYLGRVGPGDVVTGRSVAWPENEFQGSVARIGSRVDPITRSFPVRALLDNPERILRPGMLINVSLFLAEEVVIVVPEQALIQVGDSSAVYRVDDQSIAQRVDVEIGRREPGVVILRSGINAGDRIVVNGQLRLRPGNTIREATEESGQGTAPAPTQQEG